MSNLFKKAICFTDIHFGLKYNSRQHNDDCEDFIKWMIDQAKSKGCETCIFLGDWHHSRATINVSTLNYTVSNIKRLSESFENVYMLVGNHDLFYREKREIHSLPMGNNIFSNVHIIEEPTTVGNVALLPWLVEEEWKNVPKLDVKYIFGHLEFPGFMLNSYVEMPDTNELKYTDFIKPDYVFSGHFHKRQCKGKVHYIGNPFGHNFSDAGDKNRGAMVLEWGSSPEYVNWEDAPMYLSTTLSDLISNTDKLLSSPRMFIKAEIDIDVSYEEACFIKETIQARTGVREFKLIHPRQVSDMSLSPEHNQVFESVDQTVIQQLNAIDSQTFNTKLLIDLYNSL